MTQPAARALRNSAFGTRLGPSVSLKIPWKNELSIYSRGRRENTPFVWLELTFPP
jgi:hypothetical protein